MTLIVIISPLSSWLSRWQCTTYVPAYSMKSDRNVSDEVLVAVSFSSISGGGADEWTDHLLDLKVVDVDVDRMAVVVEVGEAPFLDGVQSRLDQGHVREDVVLELVGEGLGVVLGVFVIEAAADLEPAFD